MNVLIVEAEASTAEHIITLLKNPQESFVIQGIFKSIQETVNYFSSGQQTDLLILGVELLDGICFEIFSRVNVEVPIIFISKDAQYALEAFKHYSIDYLVKPFQQEDLIKAIEKWRRISAHLKSLDNDQSNQRNNWLKNENQRPKQRLLIKSGNKLQYKPSDEVAYFFADGKEVYFYTKIENKKFLIDYTLDQLVSLLDRQKFFRISRKVIVNADVIAEVKGLISTRLEVKLNQPCEHELTISRDRSAEFKAWLDQ